MPVTPSGPVSLPLEHLAVLLSNCAAFRAWTGDSTPALARLHVHLVDLPPAENPAGYTKAELTELRPLALVDEFVLDGGRPGADAWESEREALGGWVDRGKLLLKLEALVPEEDANDPAAAKLKFMNDVGAILTDVKSLGGGDTDYLSIHRIVRYHPISRTRIEAVDAQGDAMSVSYVIWWGP